MEIHDYVTSDLCSRGNDASGGYIAASTDPSVGGDYRRRMYKRRGLPPHRLRGSHHLLPRVVVPHPAKKPSLFPFELRRSLFHRTMHDVRADPIATLR